jgi:hypothetical protein
VGTWGIGAFDNDTACDWAYELAESADLSLLERAFARVLEARDEDLDVPEAEEALAAGEVVARLQGNWGPRNAYTKDVDAWVEQNKFEISEHLVTRAKAAIERVLSPPSELLKLWQETSEFEAWRAGLDGLKDRVTA